MFERLKRSRSAVSAPLEQTPASTLASSDVFTTGRTSPEALLAVLDDLNAMPRVAIEAPSNPRESQIRHMLQLDELLEATEKARAKAKDAWQRTPWALHHDNNFLVVDGQEQQDDGSVIQDGCAICGALKTECINPAGHFGARGETPPDARCSQCPRNFHNCYNSEHALQLHVAEKHAAKAG
jgi:hypothetical protein